MLTRRMLRRYVPLVLVTVLIYLRCYQQPLKRPHLIRQTDLSTLWYKKDDKFWVPKAYVMIDLRRHVTSLLSFTRLQADVLAAR